jgi:hypothetical protein
LPAPDFHPTPSVYRLCSSLLPRYPNNRTHSRRPNILPSTPYRRVTSWTWPRYRPDDCIAQRAGHFCSPHHGVFRSAADRLGYASRFLYQASHRRLPAVRPRAIIAPSAAARCPLRRVWRPQSPIEYPTSDHHTPPFHRNHGRQASCCFVPAAGEAGRGNICDGELPGPPWVSRPS